VNQEAMPFVKPGFETAMVATVCIGSPHVFSTWHKITQKTIDLQHSEKTHKRILSTALNTLRFLIHHFKIKKISARNFFAFYLY
jgi:hypothetical protein